MKREIKNVLIIETILSILLVCSYIKSDIVVIGICIIITLTVNVMIISLMYVQFSINEYDECFKQLSYHELTEVIPLTAKNNDFIKHLSKIAKFKAILDQDEMVTIYIQLKYEDTDILYDSIRIESFRKYYKFK